MLQPSTLTRLEWRLPRPDDPFWRYYRCVLASVDFTKAEPQRELLLRDPLTS